MITEQNDIKALILKQNAEIARLTSEIMEMKSEMANQTNKIGDLQNRLQFNSVIRTKKDFASLCDVEAITISRRLDKGMYETPNGYSERAYYNQGNQENTLFNLPLAMEYYEINKLQK